uniref:hypothetical protein n=1 Tax=Agathobacter sp. TaxID=2021311 RepID=UPI004056CBF1
MNKKLVKPTVLIVVFSAALLFFSILTNKENRDTTTTMDEASLPVMQAVYKDIVINELYGYTSRMDTLYVRDSITPLDENRMFHMKLLTYGREIDSIRYEVRSLDGEQLLVNDEVTDYSKEGESLYASIRLPGLFTDNEEYLMIWEVVSEEEAIYYYQRIIPEKNCYAKETLDFALQFHDYTFREDAVDFIPTYMDPATGDATTLSYVDLTCTLRQITWADFTGVKLTEPIASFKEITDSYNVITISYVMTNVNEAGETEYYNIEEYYRLRQTAARMYVLNFERTMEQIFRGENDFLIENDTILLGIRNGDIEYMANDSGECVAFVQEGELWCYNGQNNLITQVFSFRGPEGVHVRENIDAHDIRIVRVDEAGSIDFLVCGYMNRGLHEGEVGIAAYRYDGLAHTIEEEIFIPTTRSYEVLKTELEDLMYVNEQKMLYFMWNKCLYKVDLTTYQSEVLLKNISEDSYAASASSRYFAWVKQDAVYSSDVIYLEDLKTGNTHQIKAEEGTYIRPLAFAGEDFVYGTANAGDIVTDALGNTIFPMTHLQILNTSEDKQDVIKTYTPYSGFIGDVAVEDENVYVEWIANTGNGFAVIGSDTIMNREKENTNEVAADTIATDTKQKQVVLRMKAQKNKKAPERIAATHILLEKERTAQIVPETYSYYYVYVKGDVLLATKDVSEAISLANEKLGIVLNEQNKYIWKRSRSTQSNPFTNLSISDGDRDADSVVKCISIMLMREEKGVCVSDLMQTGQTPAEILETTLTEADVFELSGSTAEELLYYIDRGTPVLALTGNNQAVLLTGYSSTRIFYYNPLTGSTQSASYAEADAMFAAAGSRFIAYVK